MNTHDSPDTLPERIGQTLDRAARQPEPEFDARLAVLADKATLARQQRLHSPVKMPKNGWWLMGGFALAAGIAVMTVVPLPVTHPAATPVVASQGQPQSGEPNVDPQFLEDMDMISALGEET